MNLAATDSPLTIIKHYQPLPKALSGDNYQTLRVIIPSKLGVSESSLRIVLLCSHVQYRANDIINFFGY